MRIRLNTRGKVKYDDGTEEFVGLEFAGTLEVDGWADDPFTTVIGRIGELDAKQSRLTNFLRDSLATLLRAHQPQPVPTLPNAGADIDADT